MEEPALDPGLFFLNHFLGAKNMKEVFYSLFPYPDEQHSPSTHTAGVSIISCSLWAWVLTVPHTHEQPEKKFNVHNLESSKQEKERLIKWIVIVQWEVGDGSCIFHSVPDFLRSVVNQEPFLSVLSGAFCGIH